MTPHAHRLAFLLLIPVIQVIQASIGDRQPSFLACIEDCLLSSGLEGDQGQVKMWGGGGLAWNSEDECRYDCMHRLTDAAIRHSTPIYRMLIPLPFLLSQTLMRRQSTMANGRSGGS